MHCRLAYLIAPRDIAYCPGGRFSVGLPWPEGNPIECADKSPLTVWPGYPRTTSDTDNSLCGQSLENHSKKDDYQQEPTHVLKLRCLRERWHLPRVYLICATAF